MGRGDAHLFEFGPYVVGGEFSTHVIDRVTREELPRLFGMLGDLGECRVAGFGGVAHESLASPSPRK